MASSALKSALRSTACMQAVDLKTELLLRLTGRRQRLVGNWSATPGPPRSGRGGYEPVRAQQLAERRRRQDGRFKLARQAGLRNRVGKSLAMGHSPEQIAGRLALEHGRVIISHESIYRFIYHRTAQKDYWHRLLPRHKLRRGAAGTQAAAPPASSNNGARSPNGPPRSKAVRSQATGKPTSCCSPDMAKGCWFCTNDKPASASFSTRSIEGCPHRSDHRPSTGQASTGDPQNHQLRQRNRVRRASQASQGPQRPNLLLRSHSPWQKGGVENSIGRLRRSLPRKTDLKLITDDTLKRLVQRLNDTPRKCLDFKTPAEAFSKLKSIVALQT